jgi:hypothetical protein
MPRTWQTEPQKGILCQVANTSARSPGDLANPKVATFCAALWLTFTLPLTLLVRWNHDIWLDQILPAGFGIALHCDPDRLDPVIVVG